MGMGVEEPLLVIEEGDCNCMKEKVDELEETLSLSDLPLHGDQSDQEFSLTSNSTSSSSHNQDYFEFFSQEPNTSAAAAGLPPENIVFCGKLIPYRQLSPCKPDHQAEMKKIHHHHHHTWRLKISSTINAQVPKNENKSTTTLQHKKMYNTNKLRKGAHGFPTRSRVSVIAAPRRKAKWYFFLFGIPRLSPVVELTDIRSRRSCRHPPSSQPPMFDGKAMSDRRWGFWGLIRALSCGAPPSSPL